MGLAPLLGGLAMFGDAPVRRGSGGSSGGPVPTVALRPAPDAGPEAVETFNRAIAAAGVPASQATTAAAAALADGAAREAELRGIAAEMGAVLTEAAAETPADPRARAGTSDTADGTAAGSATGASFSDGTQALLDRLERLADLRDRGMLGQGEYETAKESVMRELEARS
jgi:hypothetical protein